MTNSLRDPMRQHTSPTQMEVAQVLDPTPVDACSTYRPTGRPSDGRGRRSCDRMTRDQGDVGSNVDLPAIYTQPVAVSPRCCCSSRFVTRPCVGGERVDRHDATVGFLRGVWEYDDPRMRRTSGSAHVELGHCVARQQRSVPSRDKSATLANVDGPTREELDRRGVTSASSKCWSQWRSVSRTPRSPPVSASRSARWRAMLRPCCTSWRCPAGGSLAPWCRRGRWRRAVHHPTRVACHCQLARTVKRGGCFGRDAVLQQLLESWEAAATETGVVLIRGEAGIGKSRLAAELAAEVDRRSGHVVFGACVDGPQRPYEPFVAALAETVDSRPRRRFSRAVSTAGDGLGRDVQRRGRRRA